MRKSGNSQKIKLTRDKIRRNEDSVSISLVSIATLKSGDRVLVDPEDKDEKSHLHGIVIEAESPVRVRWQSFEEEFPT